MSGKQCLLLPTVYITTVYIEGSRRSWTFTSLSLCTPVGSWPQTEWLKPPQQPSATHTLPPRTTHALNTTLGGVAIVRCVHHQSTTLVDNHINNGRYRKRVIILSPLLDQQRVSPRCPIVNDPSPSNPSPHSSNTIRGLGINLKMVTSI